MSDYETSVAQQTEDQIYRLKHGWGYGRRTPDENRRLAREAAERARVIARRHPFAQEVSPVPRRLVTTMPPNAPEATLARWERAKALNPDWEHVALMCGRDGYRSGAQAADFARVEELLARGGVYIDADLEVLHPLDPLIDIEEAWVPAENYADVPDLSNFALGFPPGHPALAALLELMRDRVPGPTWWSGPGALRAIMHGRVGHDVWLLDPIELAPVYWRDVDGLIRIHDMTPDQLRAEFPRSLGVHLYEGSWRSGKSRRTDIDGKGRP